MAQRYTPLVPPGEFPLIQLQGVGVNLGGAEVLRGLSWSLRAGEVWALTGHNGAGKSTFLRLVRGELWPTSGERTFALNGSPTRSPLAAKARVAAVSPELADWFARGEWSLSGWQVVLSGAALTPLPPYPVTAEHEARAREAAGRAGVEHLLGADVRALSQGQRRRVLLARALASRPAVLVLDEFWEGVDAASKARLREVVRGLAKSGVTLLYSTHRPGDALAGTTHHLHLEGGRIARQGAVTGGALFDQAHVHGAGSLCSHQHAADAGQVTVSIENADVYRGERPVLKQIDWQLREGEHWAVLGRNGAGKSTLGLLLAGELYPAGGARVRRLDLPQAAPLARRRQLIGLVSAEAQASLLGSAARRAGVTGETVVASGFFGTVAHAEGLDEERRGRLADVAARLNLADLLPREVQTLSHGQLKKLLLARAVVNAPKLLILDEPFDFLDADFKKALLGLLGELARGGTQTVFVVHHLGDLPLWVAWALCLRDGEVTYRGPLAKVPREAHEN